MVEEEQEEKQSFKESLKEILVVIKVCLTSFWFWLPPLFAIFLFIEIYLLLMNPLLFIIGPTIIVIYALMWEEKRLKAQYGLKEVKVIRASAPLFAMPRKEKVSDVNKLVEEYKKMLKKVEKSGKTRQSEG